MVNAMHVGRDHDSAQQPVDRWRYGDVAMVEDRGNCAKGCRREYGKGWGADDPNDGQIRAAYDQGFDRVMADRRSAVHVQLGVVNLVTPP